MAESENWDCVIVGGGPIGAHVAKGLSEKGKRVLILEAGVASGLTPEGYQSYVENYYVQVSKDPNSPYPPNPSAPSPSPRDLGPVVPATASTKGTPDMVGYEVEIGTQAFGSNYLRTLGGTSMHWLGTAPRHLPNDFRIRSKYGVGVDWPIGYDDIQKYYCKAEWSIGVSSEKEDQAGNGGVWFRDDYHFPMKRIPQSYSDTVIDRATRGLRVELAGKKYPVKVSPLPQARNSIPNKLLGKNSNGDYYEPVGAVGDPEKGQRCEGNSTCIPICPSHAKYTGLKTLDQAKRLNPDLVTIWTQTVASKLIIGENGRIDGVEYVRYDQLGVPEEPRVVKGKIYALAAHAIENAKLLLASNAANSSDQVGRNLMDHPFFYTWALANKSMGSFRGPIQTSGIESLRDGDFRRHFAAARIDVGNSGWDVATYPPNEELQSQIGKGVIGKELRDFCGDYFPRQVRIGYDLEQLPEARNRVTISSRYKDASGCFRPVIDYNVSDYTWQGMVEAIGVSKAIFDRMKIPKRNQHFAMGQTGLADQERYKAADGKEYLLTFVGAGHHIGTHRMGVSRTDSVVDRHCKSWDHDNLFLVGCGSLPTTATANPTLTAIATTIWSLEHMLKQL